MRFLTKKEVAELLRVSERVVNGYISSGNLLATKPGGKVLVEESDLQAFIDGGRIVAGGTPGRFM